MAKYIDAEKIRAEIERRKKENMYYELPMTIGRYYEDRDILALIDSLQQEQPVVKDPFDDEQFRRGYEAGKHDAMREQKPKIELIQRSWYMEGYNDCKFEKEPIWTISTGPGGPQYKLNPKREEDGGC